MRANIILKGGPGSGHKGRPGKVGGGLSDNAISESDKYALQNKINIETYGRTQSIEHGSLLSDTMMRVPYMSREQFVSLFVDNDPVPRASKNAKTYQVERVLYGIKETLEEYGSSEATAMGGKDLERTAGLNERNLDFMYSRYMTEWISSERAGGLYQFRVRSVNGFHFDMTNGIVSTAEALTKAMLAFGYRKPERLYDYLMKFAVTKDYSAEEFLDANYVNTKDGVLKQKERPFAILKIGTESSGFHGHRGRPGLRGGSTSDAGFRSGSADPDYLAKRRRRGKIRRMQAKLADYKKEHWDNNPSKISDTDWSLLSDYYDEDNETDLDSTFKKMFPYYSGTPKEFIESAFVYADPETGVQSTVHSVKFEQNSVSVSGVFYYRDGRYAGNFSRALSIKTNVDDSETMDVHHNLMEVDRDIQGQGFGGRFYRNSELAYAYAGADQITILVNMRVGGYAWARMGYDFKDDYVRDLNVSGAKREWDRKNKQTGKNYKFPFSKRDEPYKFKENVHAWEIAALTFPDGDRIGKSFMLGSTWSAIKYLDPKQDSHRVGEEYYEQKQKKGK